MMLALGCIQALRCNTGGCPTGITTHNPALVYGPDRWVLQAERGAHGGGAMR